MLYGLVWTLLSVYEFPRRAFCSHVVYHTHKLLSVSAILIRAHTHTQHTLSLFPSLLSRLYHLKWSLSRLFVLKPTGTIYYSLGLTAEKPAGSPSDLLFFPVFFLFLCLSSRSRLKTKLSLSLPLTLIFLLLFLPLFFSRVA